MAAKVGLPVRTPGHAWLGWTPIGDLDTAARERLVELLTPAIGTPALPDLEAVLDGRVPLCECGWSGDPVTWQPSDHRRRRSREWDDHISYLRMSLIAQEHAAAAASAALELAAKDWDGDPATAEWLQARADHVAEVGVFDGEHWPTTGRNEIVAPADDDDINGQGRL
ncbi:hypothetical protein C8046_16625 [Serinibacter arcticus]|uniref:Uncharacterized protein n=1 Tax=Serinibacter arcticus TaxID=1655435 RepID=A0A2U1ZYI2_9MICO|nr:hypothetical protein [Serinibacter arcticus]PWD52024.1 hypothetical protein C8046_16625 [Serinibacter arcticus]